MCSHAGELPPGARERAKRVTYAITYGVTPFGLAQQLQEQKVTVAAAQQLINSFLNCFQGVKGYMDACSKAAADQGYVRTLLGRRRPIQGLQVYHGRWEDKCTGEFIFVVDIT
jgi:DNA polymerase-1